MEKEYARVRKADLVIFSFPARVRTICTDAQITGEFQSNVERNQLL